MNSVITESTRIFETRTGLLDIILFSDSCTCMESFVITVDKEIGEHYAILEFIKITVNLSRSYMYGIISKQRQFVQQVNQAI